jgi:hypothetical protein
VWIFAAAVGAGLSKDVTPFIALMLGWAAAPKRDDKPWLPIKATAMALAAGCASAFAVQTAFNVFRYGSLLNATYLAPAFRVVNPINVARQFIAVVASPNGGVVAYWPSAVVLLFVGVIWCRRSQRSHVHAAEGAAVIAAVFVWFAQLAAWWSPFGWFAWGPRLAMPIVLPAVLALSVLAQRRRATVALPRWLLPVLAVCTAVGLANAGAPWNQRGIGQFMRPLGACASGPPSEDAIVKCNMRAAFTHRPYLIAAGFKGLKTPQALAVAASIVAASASTLGVASRARRVNRSSTVT